MKLIIGLWNPWDKYKETRHNLGFIFLDKFCKDNSFWEWIYESKFTADISSWLLLWEKTLLVKPQTFMNLSGESVAKICSYYKLTHEDIIVIYDDISMDFWKIRVRETWSAGWHNGVKSIIQHFKSDWTRIKAWVWMDSRYDVSDWVLSKFTADELIDIDNEIYNNISNELKKKLNNMNETKNIYLIGIGGIWVSALARYYLSRNYKVFGSDSTDSELIHALISEWCDIIIWWDPDRITEEIELVIHSEAVPQTQNELSKARDLGVKTFKYNLALAEIANKHKLIAIAGTHGKSTTTSMISQILQNSKEDFSAVIGTLLKEFGGKNFFSRWENNYFAIEACEYKEHFLAYKPSVAVITNIEYDHADYFKTPESYVDAYEKFIDNIIPWWFCVINWEDINCRSLIWKRKDIHYIIIKHENFSTLFPWDELESNTEYYPEIVMNVPGEHILFDAKLAYIVSYMIGIPEIIALETLEEYSWVWRRMEKIWSTENWNILMSDYGHHPTEITTTLSALKSWYPEKKLYVAFQPHQYSRTIELLEWFKTCFTHADMIIVPDIYESRDSDEDKAKMDSKIFIEIIKHKQKTDWEWIDNTLKLIKKYDKENPNSSIILLLGAGNIDNIRYKIKTS